MAKVRSQRARVGSFVDQHKPRRIAQHMRMNGKADLGCDPSPCHQLAQAEHSERRDALGYEYKG
jgi:hypothetical protein